MKKLKGNAVSSGVAIGIAIIIRKEKLKITRKTIKKHEVEQELKNFKTGVSKVIEEIDNLILNFKDSKENQEILRTHKMILQDPEFPKKITSLISNELYTLERAIQKHFTEIVKLFKNMGNKYLSERSSDYEDVAHRLLTHILKKPITQFANLDKNSILIMEDISPFTVIKAFEKKIKGICIEKGSINSHSSIIARSMNLPTIVNVHNLMGLVKNNQQIIIDANKYEIIISPDKETLEYYKKIVKEEEKEKVQLQTIIDIETKTKDNKKISLMSNIEIPEEMEMVLRYNSEGIGLFRTEFLFLDRDKLPTEKEQYEIYKDIADKSFPHPVIIRTIDVGGDKLVNLLNMVHENNPNLGCRGIRISLEHIPIFHSQIKAILRANEKGNIKIMFPMISGINEILKTKRIINDCKEELRKEKIPFKEDIEIGTMIEIPSAAITADKIAEECDFLSIGTNDLIQYTLAVDRNNELVSKYYQPCHPAVLYLIKMTVEKAHKKGIKVAVCGEMASQPAFVPLLLGLGVDELSVSPGNLLKVKREILNTNLTQTKKMIEKVLTQSTSKKIKKIILESKENSNKLIETK